ncbi:MAG: hypothetical protein N3G80_00850 [Candidatus Micrarchaeota archaeon]|nr:hypothetical protein [Candidatus Micrarchaeota archaeon]
MPFELVLEKFTVGASGFVGNLLEGIAAFSILVLILALGWAVAHVLGKVLKEFFDRIRIEKFLESHGVHDAFLGFTFSGIAVSLLKLYVMVAFLAIAADIIKVGIVTNLAFQAISYLPMLFQGIVIIMAALMAGDYITDRIKESKRIPFANTFAILVEVFIAYNALVIAMPLLLPAADPSLLIWSFLVVLSALAIAFGLGFAIAIGFGLKDVVAEIAKKNKEKIAKFF